ncbi:MULTISPECIES: hypothetical protein [Nostocales]|uniref:Uncharacterized protein n=3 Tax=Nostocales TaxID=1161 RepID=A0A8S9T9Y4_9CYAN|nr:hypothetical protein [Tolypothrix bouteillei]KAF3889225.1 hypothetical protein DA73_0400029900 [Tolypothrix bouteillei VB521301]
MNLKAFATTAILGVMTLIPSQAFAAQITSARTYHSGFFQPVARVNPQLPIAIKLENETGLPLDYGVLGQSEDRVLPPAGITEISNFSFPANFTVYPANPSEAQLKYKVFVKDNIATVQIGQKRVGVGERSFNVNKAGAIYIY